MSKYLLLPLCCFLAIFVLFYYLSASTPAYQEYTFTYTDTQTVSDVSVTTKTNTCVLFDNTEITFDEAKERFIEQYAVKGTLDTENKCDKDRHGDYIYPKTTITPKSDSET